MNKRKRLPYLILTILIVSILLLTSIGLSLWIISDKKEIKPELGVDKVLVQYLDNQKPTYTGDILLPSSNALDLNINNEDLTYYYKGQSDPDFIKVDNSNPEDPKGPINAGEYTIKVEYNYEVYEFDDELQKDVLVEKTFIKDNIQFEILKDIIRVEDFGFVYTKEYNTKEQTITHTSIPKGATSVSYTGALTNVGTTKVTINIEYDSINYQITENGENVNGVLSKTFEITPYDISKLSFKFEGNTNNPNNLFYYNSGNQVADLDAMFVAVHTLLDSTEVKVPKDQYTVSFPNYTTIGEYEATITAVENKNYTGSTTAAYKIDASPLTIKFEGKSLVNQFYQFDFCNAAIDISSYIKVYDVYNTLLTNLSALGISISYQYSANATNNYSNGLPTDAGLYQVKVIATVSGTPALYANEEEVFNIQIIAIPLSSTDVTASVTTTYPYNNGNAITVGSDKFSVSHSTYSTLTYGTDYVIDTSKGSDGYANNKDAGTNTAIVYLKFVGNFTGDFQTTFTITPVTPTVTPGTFSHIYYIEGQLPEPQSYGSAAYNGSSVTSGTMSLTGYTHNGTNYNDLSNVKYTVDATMQQAVTATFTYTPTLNTNNVYNYNPASATTTLYFCAAAGNVTKKLYYPTIYDAIYNSSSGDKVWVVAGLDTINVDNNHPDVRLYPTLTSSISIPSGVTFGLSYLSTTAQGTDTRGMGYFSYKIDNNGQAIPEGEAYLPPEGNKRTYMKINNGVTLTVSSNATLVVGGFLEHSTIIFDPAVIMNNGTINVNDGGTMVSFGFTKGTGSVYINPGAVCKDTLRVYDFVGTRFAAGLLFQNIASDSSKNIMNNILPFESYTMHNISCTLYIYTGAQFYTNLSLGVNNICYVNDIVMFGDNALFNLETPGGYVKRTVENTTYNDPVTIGEGSYDINGDYYSTNHSAIQKEKYEVYSNVTDSSITINLKMAVELIISVTIPFIVTTSADTYFPVSMLDMTLKSGYTMTLDSNSYQFLPGSKLTIEEGANFITGKSPEQSKPINIVFYDQHDDRVTSYSEENNIYELDANGNKIPLSKNSTIYSYWYQHQSFYDLNTSTDVATVKPEYQAKIINNGNVTFGGPASGIIETTSETSNVTLNYNSASIKEVTKLVGLANSELLGYIGNGVTTNSEFVTNTYYVRMYMKNGDLVNTNLSTPAVGAYTSFKDSENNYGYRPRYYNINIILNGGTTSNGSTGTYIYVADTCGNPEYKFTKLIFDSLGIYRIGYTMGDITYNDATGSVVNFDTILTEDQTIYVDWSINTYTITYKNVFDSEVAQDYIDAFGPDTFTSNDNPSTRQVTDAAWTLNQPTMILNEVGLLFVNWFTHESCADEYLITSLENVTSDMTLYAYWIAPEVDKITVNHNIVNETGVTQDYSAYAKSFTEVPVVSDIIQGSAISTGITAINTDSTKDGYFDKWYYDSACTIPYDGNYQTATNNGYIVDSTMTLYTKILPKIKITYAAAPTGFAYSTPTTASAPNGYDATTMKPNDYYVLPNTEIYLAEGQVQNTEANGTKVIYTFNGYSITGTSTKYSLGATLLLDTTYNGNTCQISPDVVSTTYYMVSITQGSAISSFAIKDSAGNTIKNNTYVVAGTSLTISGIINKGDEGGWFGIGAWQWSVTFKNGTSTNTINGNKSSSEKDFSWTFSLLGPVSNSEKKKYL